MKILLKICSVIETSTGLAALVVPSIIVELLLGTEISEAVLTIARLAGICLISLGIACWPGEHFSQALRAMSSYNMAVAIFFIYIGLSSSLVGILLWPVAILHFGLAVLLIRGLLLDKIKTG